MALNDRGNLLKLLRTLMRAGGVASRYGVDSGADPFHALVVPTADAHGSEYIALCDARREALSQFSGIDNFNFEFQCIYNLWICNFFHLR